MSGFNRIAATGAFVIKRFVKVW